MDAKFIHLRNRDNNNRVTVKGGTTVAFTYENGIVRFALAKCHERDNFCRRTGRVKAEGRLKSARYVREILVPVEQKPFDAIMEAL